MRLEHLKYVIDVANIGSITKASKRLFINQQQLSKIIQNIEAELGCVIFERTNKGVLLTPQGNDVFNTFDSMLSDYNALLLRLKQQETLIPKIHGDLVVNVSFGYWDYLVTKNIFPEFIAQYPNVNIFLNELLTREVIDAVSANTSQIGFISVEVENKISPIDIPENVYYIPLYRSKLIVMANKNSKYAKNHKSTSLAALQKEKFVAYLRNGESNFDKILQNLNIKYSVSQLKTFFQILSSGQAIALGIDRSDAFFEKNNLCRITIRENIVVENAIIVPKNYEKNALLFSFVNFCLQQSEKLNFG